MPIMQTRHLLFFPALAGLELLHGLMSSEQYKARPVPVTQGSALIWESGRGLHAEPQAKVIPAGIWAPSKLTLGLSFIPAWCFTDILLLFLFFPFFLSFFFSLCQLN